MLVMLCLCYHGNKDQQPPDSPLAPRDYTLYGLSCIELVKVNFLLSG